MMEISVTKAKNRVIFDTDQGVDDAMALYFALAHPDIEIIGITTTFGNVYVEQATQNALYLTRIAGRTIPVAQGIHAPFTKEARVPPDIVHGADGLGNLPNRIEVGGKAEVESGAEFIIKMARQYPGEITLVGVGPVGNIALALRIEPRLPNLLKQVVLMAGTVDEPGNVSPVAEANVWNDPHAADIVFTAGCNLIMVGLDVTHRVALPSSFFVRLAQHHKHLATDTLSHAANFYANFYQSKYPNFEHACYIHDVLTFVWLVAPEIFEMQTGRVRVAKEGIGSGQTIMAKKEFPYAQSGWESSNPQTRACMKIDVDACIKLIDATLSSNWLKPALRLES
jgi:inosine-uridine nucleoside N-ribohydrolase